MITKRASHSGAGDGQSPGRYILVVGRRRHVGKSGRELVEWLIVVESGE